MCVRIYIFNFKKQTNKQKKKKRKKHTKKAKEINKEKRISLQNRLKNEDLSRPPHFRKQDFLFFFIIIILFGLNSNFSSQFNYCPLIWKSDSKLLNKKINKLNE